jgi:hypothetical protein
VVRGAIVKTGLPPGLRESISYGSELALENADRWDSGTVGISGLLRRVVANVPYYGGLTGSLLRGSLSVGEDPVRLGLALLVPLGLILVFLDRRIGSRLPEIYLVASYALYLAWPAREEVRFLVPLLPIVLGTAAVAVDRTCRRLLVPSRRGSQALSLLAPLLAVVPGWLSVSECRKIILDERQGSYMTEGVIELREISYYLRDHAATGARVVSDSAPWVHFWSRRPTFTYPWVDDPEEVYRGLRSLDADYVLLTSLFREHTLALLQATLAHPQDFAVERREGKSVLLRVVGW